MNGSRKLWWIWAQMAFGEGSPLPWRLHREFPGGLEGFYYSGPRVWNTLDYITDQQAHALCAVTLDAARARLEYAFRLGWQVVTPECEEYPGNLRNISDPPAVLYIKGKLPGPEDGPMVAMAGARKAIPASVDAARVIAYQLASAGAVVVSGEAAGVDMTALGGALSALGRAVCVLPVDLDSPYMAKTAHLRRKVLEMDGALVTEYFSQRSPAQGGFHLRNRLITGLCRKVVLVQAAEKSGTMIYARFAASQERDLYVVPGPEDAPEYAGSRRLIREGAVAVQSGMEVLNGAPPPRLFPMERPLVTIVPSAEPPALLADPGAPDAATPEEKLLGLLAGSDLTAGELAEGVDMTVGQVLRIMTGLELAGKVETVSGRRYRRK